MSRIQAMDAVMKIQMPGMIMMANETAAISLLASKKLSTELIHFVPCADIKVKPDPHGLFDTVSLQKLLLVSADMNNDDIIAYYQLKQNATILDQSVAQADLAKLLDQNLPPAVSTTTTMVMPTTTSGSTSSTKKTQSTAGTGSTATSTGTSSLATTSKTKATKTTTSPNTPEPTSNLPRCRTLFILDGSNKAMSDFNLLKATFISAASVGYNSTEFQFAANAWVYQDPLVDLKLPESFIYNDASFTTLINSYTFMGGPDSVIQAVKALNDWVLQDAVIVLYTSSDQNAINEAGELYERQSRTVVLEGTSQFFRSLS
ncbi:unnamed protein product, partial [Mesorhabditis spiculigera]